MALQTSGTISMSQVNTELGRSASANISLDTAENGGYAAINNCSTYRPSSTNPAKISEWYGYNHTQACTLCDVNANVSATTVQINPNSQFWAYSHNLYINLVNNGDFQPVFIINSTNRNLEVNITFYDAATDYYLGEMYLSNVGAGTYTGERLGNFSTGNVKAYIYFSSGVAAANVSYSLKLNCPTTTSCGTTKNGVGPYCGGTIYHWLNLGTTSRTITVTYSTSNSGGGAQSIAVNYAGTNLTLSGSTNYGTNQTFTFNYTYNGSTTLARLEVSTTGWC